MKVSNILFSLILSLSVFSCGYKDNSNKQKIVLTGTDILISENLELLKGKNIGIISNHTALLSNGVHLVDTLFKIKGIHVTALFGPEHGIRGDNPDGFEIQNGIDRKTGIPVFSLYGKIRKPTIDMLKDVDILIFDIQDVGARFYTFISTLYYSLQAASENNIPFIVLDRPNPIGGFQVDGPIRTEQYKSFVAIAPIPIRYGMTIGELAYLFNEANFINTKRKADLMVIKMRNWERKKYYDECGIPWVKPSPNMPNLNTAIVYPGMCFLEGTNVSEGRGTYSPFLLFGAPFINKDDLFNKVNGLNLEGISISPVEFIPKSISGMSTNPKYKDKKCFGLTLKVTDRYAFRPVEFGVRLIKILSDLYPKQFKFKGKRIDKLFGDSYLREMIVSGKSAEEIIKMWQTDVKKFKLSRKKYLLYN